MLNLESVHTALQLVHPGFGMEIKLDDSFLVVLGMMLQLIGDRGDRFFFITCLGWTVN